MGYVPKPPEHKKLFLSILPHVIVEYSTKGQGRASLIEHTFPADLIRKILKTEVHSRKPIYEMHRWWARRNSSTFRAILIASFLNAVRSNTQFNDLFFQKQSLNKIVLDPFFGGGTILVEANRLGCKAIGVEINPVAWFVTKKELEPVNLTEMQSEFKKLEARIAPEIRKYYVTECNRCGSDAEVIYFFWVRTTRCPSCEARNRLFFSTLLGQSRKTNWIFCNHCNTIFATRRNEQVVCSNCKKDVSITNDVLICTKCNAYIDISSASKHFKDIELYAIEFHCNKCNIRDYKAATVRDEVLYRTAVRELRKKRSRLVFPRQRIPRGKETNRLFKFGYSRFYDFFNARQLLCLSLLFEEILKIGDHNVREFMLLTFSNALDFNNMFARYSPSARKIEPMFAHHAFYPKNLPTENNVWGGKFGRNTFVKCFKQTIEGKKYCIKPYDFYPYNGHTRKIFPNGDGISGIIGEKFDDLNNGDLNVLLRCGTSTDLSYIPDRGVDAVITDPPYFDNVMYSELANFYYVWLRIGLQEKYNHFKPKYCSNEEEIVVNPAQKKTAAYFHHKLAKVFGECNRVLRDDGLLVFTFHHRKQDAWMSVLKALLDAGFFITNVQPLPSEMSTSFHIMTKGSVKYDSILVCRKKTHISGAVDWHELLNEASKHSERHIHDALMTDSNLTAYNLEAIAIGKYLELFSKYYPLVVRKGQRVSIEDAFQDIWAEMERIISGTEIPKHCTERSNTLDDFLDKR